MDTDKQKMGALITAVRSTCGYSQKELAEKLGIEEATIVKIEEGRYFKLSLFIQILNTLNFQLQVEPKIAEKSEKIVSYPTGDESASSEDKFIVFENSPEKVRPECCPGREGALGSGGGRLAHHRTLGVRGEEAPD